MPTRKVVVKAKTTKAARKKTTVKRTRKTQCCQTCGQLGKGIAGDLLKKAVVAYFTSLGTSPERAQTGARNVKNAASGIYKIYRLYKDQFEKQRV